VLDDHRMVGQSIAGVLSELAGLVVLGVCASVAEACALIRQSPPQLLVLDVELGAENYRDAADLHLQLSPRGVLLFVTALASQFTPPGDLAERTIAVVDKAEPFDELLVVLKRWWLNSQQQSALPGCLQQLQAIQLLAPREQRLLQELGCGLLNKEIAARLQLSVATVETYRKGVAAKLGVSGHELVRLAVLARAFSWIEVC
jgi:DNA-binding NarL/FixJ family response regulator